MCLLEGKTSTKHAGNHFIDVYHIYGIIWGSHLVLKFNSLKKSKLKKFQLPTIQKLYFEKYKCKIDSTGGAR